jgi:phosphate transport system substrate-binding protein
MSRFMKPEEFRAAVKNGVMPMHHLLGYEAVAVIVHKDNPVKGLTTAQLADIYLGKIVNWKEFDGPDREIVVVSRQNDMGPYVLFTEKVLRHRELPTTTHYQGSNTAVRAEVRDEKDAIGYVDQAWADETVKALEIDGVAPSQQTVTSGMYPLAIPLFVFTNGYTKLGSHLHAFVTLYLSRDGQKLIKESGFVPVTSY